MHVIIRRAMSSDAEATADLYMRARRAAAAAAGSIPPLVHDDDQVRAWVTHVVVPRLECWLAKRAAGTIGGMLALEAEEIDQLYVDPDLTRLGIGGELIAVAKRERSRGLRRARTPAESPIRSRAPSRLDRRKRSWTTRSLFRALRGASRHISRCPGGNGCRTERPGFRLRGRLLNPGSVDAR
jgi:GNAT superfamily N-acetyltransferase